MADRTKTKTSNDKRRSRRPAAVQARTSEMARSDNLARLRWLLEFSNQSADALAESSEPKIRALEEEMGFFCESVGSVASRPSWRMTAEDIALISQETHAAISAILAGATHDFEIPNVTLIVNKSFPGRYLGSPEAIFRLAVARLIETDGHRIRQCARAGCGKLFVRRKRALYCGKKCSQLEQFTRYVEHHTGRP